MTDKEQKTVIPKCAFDKTRVCTSECVAFFIVASAAGSQFGCKRLR